MKHSLRLKIQAGFFALLVPLTISLFLFYLGLSSIWHRIQLLEVLDDIRENILEARRFEKNFLLYRHFDDLIKAKDFANSVLSKIQKNENFHLKIPNTDLIQAFKSNLSKYIEHLKNVEISGIEEAKDLREVGKRLVDLSNKIREQEVLIIDKTFKSLIHYLFILVIVAVGIMIGVGYLISQTVIGPLQDLEKCMREFVYGQRPTLSCPESQDKEIASVMKTFYIMLDELDARKEQLVQSRKLAALGTLLSGVAHELNTPLSNASSTCQIILEDLDELDPDVLKEMIDQIDKEIWRARDIVKTLLDFSRNKNYEPQNWLLSQLIEETLIMARAKLSSKISIDVDIPQNLMIYVDKQRFQQALLNLISNAIDAIDKEGKIKIYAKEDKDRYGVSIFVEDNGCGIPKDIQDKIFDPFFSTKGTKGTGLGLYIVNEIVARHGGTISLESEPKKGTKFCLFFPYKREISKN